MMTPRGKNLEELLDEFVIKSRKAISDHYVKSHGVEQD